MIRSWHISCGDYANLPHMPHDGHTMVFADPPYRGVTQSNYYGEDGENHRIFDHDRFISEARAYTGRMLLTYDQSAFDEFATDYRLKWDAVHSSRADQTGRELIVCRNYQQGGGIGVHLKIDSPVTNASCMPTKVFGARPAFWGVSGRKVS